MDAFPTEYPPIIGYDGFVSKAATTNSKPGGAGMEAQISPRFDFTDNDSSRVAYRLVADFSDTPIQYPYYFRKQTNQSPVRNLYSPTDTELSGKVVGPEGNHLNLLFRATGVKPEKPLP